MKKIITISIILLTTFNYAQGIKFGVKAGLNASSVRGNYSPEIDDIKSKTGFHIGVFSEQFINEKISIQPEFIFSLQSWSYIFLEENGFGNGALYESWIRNPKISYFYLPIMLKYKVIPKISIELGPQIGLALQGREKWEYRNSTDPSQNQTTEIDILKGGEFTYLGRDILATKRINKYDFGIGFGVSYDLTNKISFQTRYNLGLSAVDKIGKDGSNDDTKKLMNSVFQLSVRFKL